MIDITSYLMIGIIISLFFIIRNLLIDLENGEIYIEELIVYITNGLIIGLSWIISLPILIVSNILLTLINIFFGEEDEK